MDWGTANPSLSWPGENDMSRKTVGLWGIMVVSIETVKYSKTGTTLSGRRAMRKTLEKQGQIEPLQVDTEYRIFDADAWGNELLAAAHELGWKTILITVMSKYEE